MQPARVVKTLSNQHALVAYPDRNRVDTIGTKYLSRGSEQVAGSADQQHQVEQVDGGHSNAEHKPLEGEVLQSYKDTVLSIMSTQL